jgi:hypothetical protein
LVFTLIFPFQNGEALLPTKNAPTILPSGTEVHEVKRDAGGTAVDVKFTAAAQEYANIGFASAEATYENLNSMNLASEVRYPPVITIPVAYV